jgi:protein-tyrosine-phosphatase
MAHAICIPEITERGWAVQVYSAGTMDLTGTAPAIPTLVTCCQNSTPPQKDGSTFVRDLPLPTIDRFFVMEHEHVTALVTDYGVSPSRVSLLGIFDPKSKEPEIEDPMNQGSVEFDRCYSRIRRCIMHYFDTTTEIPEAPNHALQRASKKRRAAGVKGIVCYATPTAEAFRAYSGFLRDVPNQFRFLNAE